MRRHIVGFDDSQTFFKDAPDPDLVEVLEVWGRMKVAKFSDVPSQ